jgi:hypothetical protein
MDVIISSPLGLQDVLTTVYSAFRDYANDSADISILVRIPASLPYSSRRIAVASEYDDCSLNCRRKRLSLLRTRRDSNFVRELGAREVIDYRKARFEELVTDADLVLDLVGGDALE